ncbi:phosphoglycerol transferase MdoB-like AlkP superfamily enzyme [Dysgonomonas hofstadii]|uniref:Phosphoglycerol transferase MdoB-like AlkP superfamily enzyme n=1 Tax=Dysgonomonas hofstadii TaxID=637886 RepID=A0A840CU49_9BACT|nr:hypothetical protein [Dysgonomonas hofstadii]MBB4035213.1 phosphoglycerol transferase MdoB-like AlkP superfamily enzyme [Dysgonomonas hofstadii]
MDYEKNKYYTQKTNTGFWVIAILTMVLCGYLAYEHAMGFADSGFKAVDSYVYGLNDRVIEGRMSSSSSAIFNLIFAVLYFILLIVTVICTFAKNIKILMVSFVSSLLLTILVFFITEIITYS